MKAYRRILLPLPAGVASEPLLQRAVELAHAQHGQLLVVRVLDTRSGFEADGPAARLPGETAARRAPARKKRLELDSRATASPGRKPACCGASPRRCSPIWCAAGGPISSSPAPVTCPAACSTASMC